jgi:hypothetical protein
MWVNYLLIATCLFMWSSSKINTYTFLKILGLGLIIIGAIINIAGKQNSLIEIGLLFYFSCESIVAYFRKQNERESDMVSE